jgi:lysophospholipase L1-like esterase
LSIPEIALRLCLFEVQLPPPATVCAWPAADAQMADLGYFLQPDPASFYDLRPGAQYGYRTAAMDTINRHGFRGPDLPLQDRGAIRIVCLGDSSTFGMCVSEQMTWPRQLEGILREKHARSIDVINGGVIGFTVLQGLRKYQAKIREFKPDIALVAFGAINEQMPALGASDVTRASAWQQDYRRHLGKVSDIVWRLRSVQLVGGGLVEARWRERRELIHKCQSAQASFETGRDYQPRMSYDEFQRYLEEFIRALRQDQCSPVLINPHRKSSTEQRYPQVLRLSEIILQLAETEDVPVLDCNELFKRNPNHEIEYFADMHHPNSLGNRVIAESAADFLKTHLEALLQK